MDPAQLLAQVLPEWVKKILRPVYELRCLFVNKYASELAYWKTCQVNSRFNPATDYYRSYMQAAMAQEPDDSFLAGKVVADFGCGPLGSLTWATSAAVRIGIDVLADRYADEFLDDIASHGMIYVKSTEHVIPLPSSSVDVLFTLNAIDHVDSFSDMCRELLRIMKLGGEFIGSFNLEERPTPCEPQQLTEALIKSHLLDHLTITSYRLAQKGPPENPYGPVMNGENSYRKGQHGYLWVRAKKV